VVHADLAHRAKQPQLVLPRCERLDKRNLPRLSAAAALWWPCGRRAGRGGAAQRSTGRVSARAAQGVPPTRPRTRPCHCCC
jgi:hypothetical protein